MARVLVTGTAGFIGFHVAKRLLAAGHTVTGYDGMTPYYDVSLKRRRHALLNQMPGFSAHEAALEDMSILTEVWRSAAPDIVIHLAAQAGVRYGLEAPRAYAEANMIGTFNVLESARAMSPKHLLVASTSSVYGANAEVPFRETDKADNPLSYYAATKKATEAQAHSYAHLFKVPTTVFRFFTVYGPWGRPDMALFKFTKSILNGEPIELYNHGDLARDFTYVDDIIEGIVRLMDVLPVKPETEIEGDTLSPVAPYRIVNLGAGQPVQLLDFVDAIERALGRKAERVFVPMVPGDVPRTFANVDLLERLTGFRPKVGLDEGVKQFIAWYKDYYR